MGRCLCVLISERNMISATFVVIGCNMVMASMDMTSLLVTKEYLCFVFVCLFICLFLYCHMNVDVENIQRCELVKFLRGIALCKS